MNKLKFTLQLWMVVWLLVTTISYAITATGITMPLPARTLLLSGIMVPIMVFIVIPFLKRPAA